MRYQSRQRSRVNQENLPRFSYKTEKNLPALYEDFDDENASIQMFIKTDEEQLNYDIFNHSIYNPDRVLDLILLICLADSNHKLAIKMVHTLQKNEISNSKA